MAKKFDGNAYVEQFDGKIAGLMTLFIVVSIVLAFWLNYATRTDCTTHEYVFCGTPLEDAHEASEGGHGAEGAAKGAAHGDDHAAPSLHGGHEHEH